MRSRPPLDKVDLAILGALQENAERSVGDVSKLAGVSPSPCWKRIERLKDEGYIRKTVAYLDRAKLGFGLQFFVQIKLRPTDRETLREFTEAIRRMPEVADCFVLSGDSLLMLRVLSSDLQSYEAFLSEKLLDVAGIDEIRSFISASQVKMTTALPIKTPPKG